MLGMNIDQEGHRLAVASMCSEVLSSPDEEPEIVQPNVSPGKLFMSP